MKEYALLHRRKGIDRLDVFSTPLRRLRYEEPTLGWRAGERPVTRPGSLWMAGSEPAIAANSAIVWC